MLLVVAGWLTKAPMLAEWTHNGLISAISFPLLFAATFSLLAGALKVQPGGRSRHHFTLHLVFAAPVLLSLRFMFSVPLAIGLLVAATEMLWPIEAQTATDIKTGTSFA